MTDVVEHLPPDMLHVGFMNVAHWLSPTGMLVIHTFPTLGPHRLYQRLLKSFGKRCDLDKLNAIHCNVQTRRSLRAALEQAAFRVERLWIQNDFALTSSVYDRLNAGFTKTAIRVLLNDVLGSTVLRAIFGEFAALSIYAVARPANKES